MEVRATEQALYEEIGRQHIANKAMAQRVAILNSENAKLDKENARLRSDVDRLASELPEEAVAQGPTSNKTIPISAE